MSPQVKRRARQGKARSDESRQLAGSLETGSRSSAECDQVNEPAAGRGSWGSFGCLATEEALS